jgi:hypothetical protein
MAPPAGTPPPGERWWSLEESRQRIAEQRDAEQRATGTYSQSQPEEEFPRIVRSRLRG